MARLLKRYGLAHIDLLVLTHPQRDQFGGAAQVIERFPVCAVVLPGLPVAHAERDAVLELAARKEIPVTRARRGTVYRAGPLRVEVLWPDGPCSPAEDPNRRSVVLRAAYEDTDALLPADAESAVTNTLGLGPAEVLKVAHHGSRDEGLPALLRRTQLRLAIVSAGEDNRFGQPAPSTLAALAEAPGLVTFRTDRDGTVIVETDRTRLTVATAP
ncbi:MAG: MBL fold metallo-hydrolase [Actinomycetia bacterium]|nr:MBL fold metallo-hydrolase [Actinomycetes bacterium]